jgi:hypothetical protein
LQKRGRDPTTNFMGVDYVYITGEKSLLVEGLVAELEFHVFKVLSACAFPEFICDMCTKRVGGVRSCVFEHFRNSEVAHSE